ncbi:MAG: hypothetical protein AAGC79_08920 [Pseudomonadota bacterium]
MAWLTLQGLGFSAAVCSEANTGGAGSRVTNIAKLNLERMLWVEAHEAARMMSFQLDPDRWLVVRFASAADFATAARQVEGI